MGYTRCLFLTALDPFRGTDEEDEHERSSLWEGWRGHPRTEEGPYSGNELDPETSPPSDRGAWSTPRPGPPTSGVEAPDGAPQYNHGSKRHPTSLLVTSFPVGTEGDDGVRPGARSESARSLGGVVGTEENTVRVAVRSRTWGVPPAG